MIEATSITKRYGLRTALRDVTLSVAPGECVALIGPNGAGKTTLLRILATLSRPTSGAVRIAGEDAGHRSETARGRIGFVGHQDMLYGNLTACQNLRFYARMYGVADPGERIAWLIDQAGLSPRRDDLVRTYSHGMRMRLALARAVLHRPDVLLLDEPYSGLDVAAAEWLAALVPEATGRGGAALIATHDISQGLSVGDRIVVLSRGQVAFDSPSPPLDVAAFTAAYRQLVSIGE